MPQLPKVPKMPKIFDSGCFQFQLIADRRSSKSKIDNIPSNNPKSLTAIASRSGEAGGRNLKSEIGIIRNPNSEIRKFGNRFPRNPLQKQGLFFIELQTVFTFMVEGSR